MALVPKDPAKISEFSFGIRHVDDGPHAFEIAFGGAGSESTAIVQCNGFVPTGTISFQCDAVRPDEAPGAASILPRFAGIDTYSIEVSKDGVLLYAEKGRKDAMIIPGFDDPAHAGSVETLGVSLVYGLVRGDAWTIEIVHEAFVVSITPDGSQPFEGLDAVSVRTEGLNESVVGPNFD